MGIFDRITIESPLVPSAPGVYQAYIDLSDSYGDYYRIDADGILWRLSIAACMNPTSGRLDPPVALDYTDPALEVYSEYEPEGSPDYLLTFDHGRLIACALLPS